MWKKKMEQIHLSSSLKNCISAGDSGKCIIKGEIVVDHSPGQSGPAKSLSVRIYSRTNFDKKTDRGKLSEKAHLKCGKTKNENGTRTTTYKLKFQVDLEFGIPGALLIENQHKNRFFLQKANLQTPKQLIHFECRSWVYPIKETKTNRIFFSNTSCIPSKTPCALWELRKEELKSLRGHGLGERKEYDRIYDYDYYNDLGNPYKGKEHVRPVFGGSKSHPYPRRGSTGCPLGKHDPSAETQLEMINLDVYVPPDETFSPKKMSEFIGNAIQAAIHFLIPEAKALVNAHSERFESFDEILDLFSSNRSQAVEGEIARKLKKSLPHELFKETTRTSKEDPMKFPLPQIIAGDSSLHSALTVLTICTADTYSPFLLLFSDNQFAWKDDEEFGRQMLAGTNPTLIKLLQEFPPRSENGITSSIKASDIEHNLDGLPLNQVMEQRRIFVLDHHDYLMPFLSTINKNDICAYASRTLFFLRSDTTLKPVAIELSLPSSSDDKKISRVFVPASEGTKAALWHLAKAHVAANDSGYHQIISHWLHTHAVIEPFIIASRRQLSVMHPIHQLLDPHFKDTMHINALARRILINSGGILERTLFLGKFSMELSSELYKQWRFDEQALPNDLLKRNMAFKDPESTTGVRLLFEDYPYATDGLEIWTAINVWVRDFCNIFYKDDNSVSSDEEIQAWWSEIRNVGHGDKRNETWWYQMKDRSDLIKALTTLIWIASALHASVNFGQYAYAGYPTSRPAICRKFIPEEGTKEFAEFLLNPDKYYLKMVPQRFEATLSIAVMEVLSRHISDEVYLGQRQTSKWIDNKEVLQKFQEFQENLKRIEKKISLMNGDPSLKNRWGPAKVPYRLLYPDTSKDDHKGGITGKGIPNSISI